MRIVKKQLICLLLYFVSSCTFASSCTSMVNEYYLLCVQGKCSEGVESFKVAALPRCNRHAEISPAPDWMLQFAEKVLEIRKSDFDSGIIRIEDTRSFGQNTRVNTFEEFATTNGKTINYFLEGYYPENQNIEFGELLATMDEFEPHWITQYSTETSTDALRIINDDLVAKARIKKIEWFMYWLLYWCGAAMVLATFVWTINSFYTRLDCIIVVVSLYCVQ